MFLIDISYLFSFFPFPLFFSAPFLDLEGAKYVFLFFLIREFFIFLFSKVLKEKQVYLISSQHLTV
jgi:hypothetical protein